MRPATAPLPEPGEKPAALRILIADAESASRRRLRSLLSAMSGVQVIGECQDGRSVLDLAETLGPDLVMLDVQLPGMSGLQVVERLAAREGPEIVFMSRSDRFDVRALELHALDHLLKPIDENRLAITVQRARLLGNRDPEPEIRPVRLNSLDRLAVRVGTQIVLHPLEDIDWVEAAGNYSHIHIGAGSVIIRRTIGELESALDTNRFLRVHRSTIVNVCRIRALEPVFKGEYVVILKDGTRVSSSRSYRANIQRLLSLCG